MIYIFGYQFYLKSGIRLQKVMQKIVNKKVSSSEQQACYGDDSYDEQVNNDEIQATKKRDTIPRFIKNKIDQINTNVIVLNVSKGTQYEVVQEAAKELGWEIQTSKKSQKWDIMWIDSHIEAYDLYRLNDHQKISHFPAIYVLTRKNFLGKSLMKMRNIFPKEYNYFPSTWSLPTEYDELLRFDEKLDKNQKKQFYIYKPQAMSQGKGIKLQYNVPNLQGKVGIVQQYINNPFLIEKLKFDLRIYVLIMGYDPLRIFIYDQGLGRFATQKYQSVKKKNMRDVHIHLTNYAINKNNKKFIFNKSVKQMDKGHKRSLSAIYNIMNTNGIDSKALKNKIDELIIKTLLVGQPMIAHTYSLAQSDNHVNDLCFHILGFDILINDRSQPILLQVNHTPSFHTDTPLDKFIKKNLIKDTLHLLNVNVRNKKEKIDVKKKQMLLRAQRKLGRLTSKEKQEMRVKKGKQRDEYQLANLGNYRKIFPTQQSIKYKSIIQASNWIFNQASGIKNKNLSSSKRSFGKTQNWSQRHEQKMVNKRGVTEPLLGNLDEKGMESSMNDTNLMGRRSQKKQEQDRENMGKRQSTSSHSKSKLPVIETNKQPYTLKNPQRYLQYGKKQCQITKQLAHRLSKSRSHRRNIGNTLQQHPQDEQKPIYISPTVLQINTNKFYQTDVRATSNQIPNQLTPNNLNTFLKLDLANRIKNCEKLLSNQTLIQIQSMGARKNKYGNLLGSLCIGKGNRYKEDIGKFIPN